MITPNIKPKARTKEATLSHSRNTILSIQRKTTDNIISIMNNSSSYHPSKNQPGDERRRRIVSSSAPAYNEEPQVKISSLNQLHAPMASEYRCPSTALYKANVNSMKETDENMQVLRIPTKSENCNPGPKLNPASCASGLVLLDGGGEVSDLSLTAFVERINRMQGNTRGRTSSLQNEGWDDFHSNDLDSSQGSWFLEISG